MTNDSSQSGTGSNVIDQADQRRIVRDRYADIATESSSCCGDDQNTSCCSESETDPANPDEQSRTIGYSERQISEVESGANLGLGCGNPTALADLQKGDTVLDLGSGAGFDCFLAAREVGPSGRVIGVDMTPEMIAKARDNVQKNDAGNVEFRLGEIEHLPLADDSVDVIISNCVVNLSPDKPQVFREALRVLRPGGYLAISDVVQTAPFPEGIRRDTSSVAACVAGALQVEELESILEEVGFTAISIDPKEESEEFIREWDDERDVSEYIVSATIEGQKPKP
jgi:arsenite methyltransferase